MKKNRSFSIGATIISLIAIIAVLTSYIPNILLQPAPTPTASSLLTPSATSTPDACAPENLQAIVVDFNSLAREFDDLSLLAQNMPRKDLAATITDLQRIRRNSENYSVPACMETLKALQLAYMNSFIDTLLALFSTSNNANNGALTEDDVTVINQGMSQAIQYQDQYISEIQRLLGVSTATPTLGLSPNGTEEGPASVTTTPTP